jgi:hypothetical protein
MDCAVRDFVAGVARMQRPRHSREVFSGVDDLSGGRSGHRRGCELDAGRRYCGFCARSDISSCICLRMLEIC